MRCDVASAEMIKLAANAALMTRISFINEIANVCEPPAPTSSASPRAWVSTGGIGASFLRAGIGYGGSCFPKDSLALKQLAGELGLPLPAPERRDRGERAAEAARDREARSSHLGSLRGKTRRAARARVQAGHGRHAGGAEPRPRVRLSPRARRCARGTRSPTAAGCCRGADLRDSVEALDGADAAVIVTEWHQLRGARLARGGRSDAESAADRRAEHARSGRVRAAGFTYDGIGRAAGLSASA